MTLTPLCLEVEKTQMMSCVNHVEDDILDTVDGGEFVHFHESVTQQLPSCRKNVADALDFVKISSSLFCFPESNFRGHGLQ